MPVYMKIDGIPGECRVLGHENEIELDSFSWSGATNNTVFGPTGFTPSKFQVDGLRIAKRADLSTLPLMQRIATGRSIPKVQLSVDSSGGSSRPVTYLKYYLGGVFVVDLDQSYSSGDPVPTDALKLKFNQIYVEYYQQNSSGQMILANKAGWDFAKNQALNSPP